MRVKYLEERIADMEKCTPCEKPGARDQKKPDAFLFPNKQISDYIVVGTLKNELEALTACLWVNTTEQGDAGLISYATNGNNNEFLLYTYLNRLRIIWGPTLRITSVRVTDGKWHHVCVTWDASSATYEMYKDGALAETGEAPGETIAAGGLLIFGQDQDSVGGGFREKEAFTGEMTGINLWDHVKSDAEISELAKSCSAGEGNVVGMADLREDRVKGGVLKIASTCSSQ
ncbi:neuronal pentraxin-2-like [Oculina patagonica]